METSQAIGKISEALAKAQGQMKPAVFDAANPHFKSKYASLAAIMDACRAALSANSVAVVQGTSVEENRVVVSTMLVHGSGEWIRDSLSIKLVREDAQAIGSAITYARRYSLASMVGIVADEDDDAENAVGRNGNGSVPNPKPVLTRIKKADGPMTPTTPIEARPEETNQPMEPTTNSPKGPTPVTQKPANGNGRVAKIRILFTLSSQLGQTTDQMKADIGTMLGMDRPIKESSEIPNDQLDRLIDNFKQALTAKAALAGKEAA
ncbi:MAG: hypothetical protein GX442_00410 [Candidatus Riflebacteria bacterium]|nr:hypothetical protein [Candidatus Riflebacteria bacterium]